MYNPSAVYIIEHNIEKINYDNANWSYNWDNLIQNNAAIYIIEHLYKNYRDVSNVNMSCNSSCINILLKNPRLINFSILSQNPHPKIINLILKNRDKIDKYSIYYNNLANKIYKKCPDGLYWLKSMDLNDFYNCFVLLNP